MRETRQTAVSVSLAIAVLLFPAACTTNPPNKPSAQAAHEKPSARKPGATPKKGTPPGAGSAAGTFEPANGSRETRAEFFTGTGNFIDPKAASRPAYVATSTGDLTLNFQGSDIQEVVKTILGDILQVNYTIDEKVKGSVYLQTSEPIGPDALIPMLEALLRMKGAVLIKSDSLYKIVPQNAALSSAVSPDLRLLRDKGFQVLVVPLRYIAAREMEKILKPLQPTNGLVQVDSTRNLLILAGTQVELAHLLKTVKTFDVDQLKGMSVGLFRLSSIDTKTLLGELQQILGSDSADPKLAGMLRFLPIERLNALLVITPQAKYLKDVQTWIDRLDHAAESATMDLHVYYVQNGRAAHLAELLTKLFEKKAAAGAEAPAPPKLAPGATPALIESKVSATSTMQPAKPEAPTITISPTGVLTAPPGPNPGNPNKKTTNPGIDGAASIAPSMGDLDVGAVTIIADEKNNALIVKATPADYAKIERVVRKLDILPLQVLVEATIVDVELTGEFSYGIEWFWKSKFGDYNVRGILDLGSAGLAPIAPGFSYTVIDTANVVRGVLNTLASDSKLTVIASPHLMVLDNTTATINIGDQVPIRTSEASSIQQSGETPIIASTIQYLDTGVLLQVTPRVNASGLITMDLTQEVNGVEVTTSSGIDSPTINQRRINTTVAVQSGDTIVLGGLIRDSKTKSESGIPGLRKIPGLGWLFGSRRKTSERAELLILITPTAIKDQGQARAVTEELKERMKNLSFPDWVPGTSKSKSKESQEQGVEKDKVVPNESGTERSG